MLKTSPLILGLCLLTSASIADMDAFRMESSKSTIGVSLPAPSPTFQDRQSQILKALPPQDTRLHILIDDFDRDPILNRLGGLSGAWDMDPNNTDESCVQSIVYDLKNSKNKVLRLRYDVEAAGTAYNGFWTRLNGLKATSLDELRFWVRGDPREGFTRALKIELKSSQSKSFLYIQGISTRWQEVIIPLKKFKDLNKERLDELVIVFEDHLANPKKGTLYFDDFSFRGSRDTYKKELATQRSTIYQELSDILSLDDAHLIELLQKKIFQYFLDYSDPATGLIKDRSLANAPASIAATGFGLVSFCMAEKNGWLSRVEAYNRVLKILRTLEDYAPSEHGYFYHFLDPSTAKRWANSEISSIDTALLMAGILFVRQYFPGTEVSVIAERLYNRVEWNWMAANDKGLLYMQWTPETHFEGSSTWNMAAEEMILYLLALGSEQFSLPSESWHAWNREKFQEGDLTFVSEPGRSLFTHLYSHAFVDFRDQRDSFLNYWENSRKAVLADRAFCVHHQHDFKGYGPWSWGLSASDGPGGYQAYGARDGAHDGTLAPYALIASVPFAPETVFPSIRHLLLNYGDRIWGPYGPTSAFNPRKEWYSTEYIGIDEGIMLLMTENYRSEFVWKHLMQSPAIQRGMQKAGFIPTPPWTYVATPNWISSIYMVPVFWPTA